MTGARPVRIARSRSTPFEASPPRTEPRTQGALIPNHAGTLRARRTFVLFAAVLVGMYVLFTVLFVFAPGGLSAAEAPLGVLALIAVAFLAYVWTITLGRAPRSYAFNGDHWVLVERTGRSREFSTAAVNSRVVAQRFPAGALAPEPTELLALEDRRGRIRYYLLARDALRSMDGPATAD